MLAYLMDVISPGNQWKHRLQTLIEHYGIMTRQMGFPEDFADRPIWAAVSQETACATSKSSVTVTNR
jgi:hypothetical protein